MEFRLRGQDGSLADHIHTICYGGEGLRSKILNSYYFHAITLSKFLTQKKMFFKAKKSSLAARRQHKIMFGLAIYMAWSKTFWLGQGKWEWKREERENYPIFQSHSLIQDNSLRGTLLT